MIIPLPLVLAGAVVFLSYQNYSAYITKKQIDEIRLIKKIDKKAINIKNRADIANLNGDNIQTSSIDVISDTNRISDFVVPSLKHGTAEEILLDKHYRATLKHFETSTDTNTPPCGTLALTGLITEEECTKVSNMIMEFYTYENEEVSYNVPSSISNKVSSLSKTTVTALDADTDTIKNKSYSIESEFLENKKYDLTFKYNEQIEKLVDDGEVDLAKAINNKLQDFNSIAAQSNIDKYGW